MMTGPARRDLPWAALMAAALALLFLVARALEWWPVPPWQNHGLPLDALLGAAVALLLPALWYAWRRIGELRAKLRSRAEAEATLRESIKQITTVLDYAPVEIYVKDLAGHNILANRRAIELFAPDEGTLRGRTAEEIFPEHEAELYRAQDRAIMETGKAAHWEYDLPFQGSIHNYFAIKFPILNAAGEIVQIGTIVSDISELKQREAALRDSEARFRAIIDNTPCGISLKDTEGRYILVNRWYETHLARTSKSIEGKRPHDVFSKDCADPCVAQDDAVLRSGAVIEQEEEWRVPGDSRALFTVKFPVRDSSNQVVAIGSIITDISERKRAEAQDRVNQARLQAILDYSPLALYLTDSDGRLLLVNRRFEEWFGISNDAAIGKRLAELFGEEDSHCLEQLDQEVLRYGSVRQSEATKVLGDGTLRNTMIAKFPVFDGHGGVLGTGSAEIDITDLKSAQRALQSAKEEADRASTAKSRFLAAASHDLRQPLHALNLLIEAMLDEADESGREAITSAMRQATSSMGEMLNALLDISQLDAGTIRPEPQNFRIGPFLEEMARTVATRAAAKGLELRVVPSRAIVRSDRTLLGRIVENLLSNAVRYTAEGKILLGCRRRGERLCIEVHDSGIGIPQEHVGKIFEEYFQLGNQARDRSKGLGLGLAIVERLSRILDHPVTVRSYPGKGSCFAVEVPLGQLGESEARPPDGALNRTRLRGHAVLLIEDDSLVMEWTQRLLRSWEMTVWTANTSAEIRRRIEEAGDDINLIIADLRLPCGESGLDLIHHAREALGAPVPAIVTTGDTSPELPRLCADAGCSLLHKPIAPAKLRSLVRWLLSEQRVG
ncbi:MAG: PAS domain-containing protein [Kiloniellales bacterium]